MPSTVRTADYANSCHWDTIIGRPDFANVVNDIGGLKASGYKKGDVGVWNGKKFTPVNRNSLINTSSFYSADNKPYLAYTLPWSSRTITPLNRTSQVFTVPGVAEGMALAAGISEVLDGCVMSIESGDQQIIVTIQNPTPYVVTVANTVITVLYMK